MIDPPELTEESLNKRCAYWQKALRLNDWQFAVAILSLQEMQDTSEEEDVGAHIRHVAELRKGLISVVRSEDMPLAGPFARDWEQSLVHELLHIHCHVFGNERDTPEHLAEEQAVDALAGALVSLHRSAPDPDRPDPSKDLRAAVDWWQPVLELRDWHIRPEFVPRRYWHESPDASGYCNPDMFQQNAVLHLPPPDEEDGWISFPEENDVEVALVHEMIHLHTDLFWDHKAEGLKRNMQERAVEMIAQALVHEARSEPG